MATAGATHRPASVRYAPQDPTLPKPWKGLVDTHTGYLYFWNPETNVTQYEKPVASSNASPASPDVSCLSVQKSQSQHSKNDDENRYNHGSSDSSAKADSGPGANQVLQVVLS